MRDSRIDGVRGLACLLLVLYHVIGSTPDYGLRMDAGHPLRFLADGLSDIRMPLFAFVSGYVYQFNPARRDALAQFISRKTKVLLIPGLVAITVFFLLSNIVGTSFSAPMSEFWKALLYPYSHFWFLQAIFLIFLLFASLDSLLGPDHAIAILLVGSALYALDLVPGISFFSVNQAFWLLPFFAFGVVVHRTESLAELPGRKEWALCAATILIVAACKAWLSAQGLAPASRFNPLSLALGLSVSLMVFRSSDLWLAFAWMGRESFVIFLYHPIGSSAMRRLLGAVNWTETRPSLFVS